MGRKKTDSTDRVTITFAVNKVLSERLQLFLGESGLTQSSVVREAIDIYLRSKEQNKEGK